MSRRAAIAAGVGAVVVVALVAGALVWRHDSDDDNHSDASSPSSSSPSNATGGEGLKPLIAGLLNRDGPASDAARTVVSSFVVNVQWDELQPEAGGPLASPNPIDAAVAEARRAGTSDRPVRVKVRLFTGIHAPDWAKSLGGAPVKITDPQTGTAGTIGRFWTPEFGQAYDDLQRLLAEKYDDVAEVSGITAARCTTVFSEPFIRDVRDHTTVEALLAAGFTADKDAVCQREQVDAGRAWKQTRTSVAYNPYQHIRANGTWFSDLDFTEEMMDYCRSTLGSQCILENNSVRWPLQNDDLYQALDRRGPPLEFQTATQARVGDLQRTIEYTISIGANAVELPAGASLPDSELQKLDAQLRANAVKADTHG